MFTYIYCVFAYTLVYAIYLYANLAYIFIMCMYIWHLYIYSKHGLDILHTFICICIYSNEICVLCIYIYLYIGFIACKIDYDSDLFMTHKYYTVADLGLNTYTIYPLS